MRWSFRLVRIFGIDIRVHVSFFLILILGAFQWGGSHGGRGAFFGALLMALLFACVTLHELAHSVVARRFGIPVREILLLPIGGISRLERNAEKPIHEFWISAVGPLVNFAIAAVLLAVTRASTGLETLDGHALLHGQAMAPSLSTLVSWLIAANVTLALFNLLPAFPMDGGRMLRAGLAHFLGGRRATQIAATVGQLIAIALGVLGVLGGNIVLALVAVFIFFAAGQEKGEETTKRVLSSLKVGDAYNKHALTLEPGNRVSRVVDYILTSYQPDFAVLQGSRLLGTVSRKNVLQVLATQSGDPCVAGVMDREVVGVDAGATLDEVRQRMIERGTRLVAVYEGDRYLGLVSIEDITEALLVATFLKRHEDERQRAKASAA